MNVETRSSVVDVGRSLSSEDLRAPPIVIVYHKERGDKFDHVPPKEISDFTKLSAATWSALHLILIPPRPAAPLEKTLEMVLGSGAVCFVSNVTTKGGHSWLINLRLNL